MVPEVTVLFSSPGGVEKIYFAKITGRKYTTSFGSGALDNPNNIAVVKQKKETILQNQDVMKLEELISRAKRIEAMKSNPVSKDAWLIKMTVDKKTLLFYSNDIVTMPKEISELLRFILDKSPLPIDLHGWS